MARLASETPLIFEFPQTEEHQWKLTTIALSIGRPFVMAEGSPLEIMDILRRFFSRTLRDMEFLEEARHPGIYVNAVDRQGGQKLLREMYDMPQAVIGKVEKIFAPALRAPLVLSSQDHP